MPAWITDLIPLAPWLAAIAVLVWLGVKAFPWLRKLMHFIDDVSGEPARAGMPARPGLMERLTVVEQKQDAQAETLATVSHEVTTNHGSSLKDAVKVVSASVDELHGSVNDVQQTLNAQGAWQVKHEEKSDALVQRIDRIEEK